jgi:hypothetical protein
MSNTPEEQIKVALGEIGYNEVVSALKHDWLLRKLWGATMAIIQTQPPAVPDEKGDVDWPIECRLDQQQCHQECEHKSNRLMCPFASRLPYKKEFEAYFRKYYPHLIPSAPLNDAVEFAEWLYDDINPFIRLENGRWCQAAGNSTTWTTEQLYKIFRPNAGEGWEGVDEVLRKISEFSAGSGDNGWIEFDKVIRCLALELPEAVWNDVNKKYQALKSNQPT